MNEVVIDFIVNGLENVGKIRDAIRSLRGAADGGKAATGAVDALGVSAQKSERDTLQLAQAQARLQQTLGDSAGAIRTLQGALADVDQATIQAVRAQTQLAYLQTQYANSPLISAIRGQQGALDGLSQSAEDTGQSFGAASEDAQRLAQAIREIAQNQPAGGDDGGFIGGLKNIGDIAGAVANLYTLYSVAQSAQEKFKDGAISLGDVIKSAFRNSAAEVAAYQEQVSKATEQTSQTSAREPLFDFIKRANQQIVEASLKDQAAKQAGKNVAEGFAQGVRAGTPQAEHATRDAAKKATDAAEAELGIASPSRVFFQLGVQTIQGWINGVRAQASAAQQAVRATLGATAQQPPTRLPVAQNLAARFLPNSAGAQAFAAQIDSALERVRSLGGQMRELALTTALGGAAIAGLGIALLGATPALAALGKAGLEANAQLERTRIGIASIIASVGELRTAQGVKLTGVDALNAALPLARRQLELLRVDALQTSLTFEQLAPAFLQAIGPGLAAGLNFDEVRQAVTSLSQLIVPLTGDAAQLGQELRAIFSGDVGPDSQVANTLFGSARAAKEQITAAREAGTLADLLNEKLKVAAATGKLVGKTFDAASSNLAEAGNLLAATVTKGLFDRLRDTINSELPRLFETAFGRVRIAGAFAGLAEALGGVFDRAGQLAERVITGILNGLRGFSAFLQQNRDAVNGLVNSAFELVGLIGRAFLAVGQLGVGLLETRTAMTIINTAFQVAIDLISGLVRGLEITVGLVTGIAQALDRAFGKPLQIVAQVGVLALSLRGAYQAALLLAPVAANVLAYLTGIATRAVGAAASMTTLAGAASAASRALSFLVATPAGLAILAASLIVAGQAFGGFASAAERAQQAAGQIKLTGLQEQADVTQSLREQLDNVAKLTGNQAALNAEQARFQAILSQLPGAQQAVIEKLSTHEERVKALTAALQANLQEEEAAARAQQITLTASIATRQQEIEQTKNRLKLLDEEIEKRRALLAAGQRTETRTIGGLGEEVTIVEDLAEAQGHLAAERNKLADSTDEQSRSLKQLNQAQAEEIQKLALTTQALNQTEEALLKARQAGGLTADQFNAFKAALDNARAAGQNVGVAVDGVTLALNKAQTAAEQARAALADFFSTGDASNLRKLIAERVNRLAAEAAKPGGGGVAGALRQLNQDLKANKDGLADAAKTITLGEKIQKALNDRLNPPARPKAQRAPARPNLGADQQREREALADAALTLEKALAQREIELARATATEQTRLLEEQLAAREIGLTEFHDRKRQIEEQATRAVLAGVALEIRAEQERLRLVSVNEQAALQKSRATEAEALAKTRKAAEREKIIGGAIRERAKIANDATKERFQTAAKIIDLQTREEEVRSQAAGKAAQDETQRLQRLRELNQQFADIANQLRAATGDEIGAAIAEVQQRFSGTLQDAFVNFGPLSDQFLNTLRLIQAEIDKLSFRQLETELRTVQSTLDSGRAQIQNLVAEGLISEKTAREQILALERASRVEQEKKLVALGELIDKLQDGTLKEALSAQVLQLRVELQKVGIDPLIQSIRDGLNSDIKGAFESFFADFGNGLESLRDLALGVVNSFRRALAKIISDQIDDKLIQPLVNKFLGFIGLDSASPTDIADTVATNANTTALATNTAAVVALTAAQTATAATGLAGQLGSFAVQVPSGLAPQVAGAAVGGAAEATTAAAQTAALTANTAAVSGATGLLATITGLVPGLIAGLGGQTASASANTAAAFGLGASMSVLTGAVIALTAVVSAAAVSNTVSVGLAEGGFTPAVGVNQPAGIVHGGEWVAPAWMVRNRAFAPVIGALESVRNGGGVQGLFDSVQGRVNVAMQPRVSRGYMAGGLVAEPGGATGGATPTVNIRNVTVFDPAEIENALNSSTGEAIVMNHIKRRSSAIRQIIGV